MPVPVPSPTPIRRLVQIDNLHVCLVRGGLHAPNSAPNDGLVYKPNHDADVQAKRRASRLPCGPRGVIHDYVPFYFGCLSPMLLRLKTGRVTGFTGGQEDLVYLVSTAQAVEDSGTGFVFSDGHGLAAFTEWFDDLARLDRVDWNMVNQKYWKDTVDDPDRQRRKQAEFLIHRFCDWSLIKAIGVIDEAAKQKVEAVLAAHPKAMRRPVLVQRPWYY